MTNPAQPLNLAAPAPGAPRPLPLNRPLLLSTNQSPQLQEGASPQPKCTPLVFGAATNPAVNRVNLPLSSAAGTPLQLSPTGPSQHQPPAMGTPLPLAPVTGTPLPLALAPGTPQPLPLSTGTPLPLAGGVRPAYPGGKLPVTIPLSIGKRESSDELMFPAAPAPSPVDEMCDAGRTRIESPPCINDPGHTGVEALPSNIYVSDAGRTCMEPPPIHGYQPPSDPGRTVMEPPPSMPAQPQSQPLPLSYPAHRPLSFQPSPAAPLPINQLAPNPPAPMPYQPAPMPYQPAPTPIQPASVSFLAPTQSISSTSLSKPAAPYVATPPVPILCRKKIEEINVKNEGMQVLKKGHMDWTNYLPRHKSEISPVEPPAPVSPVPSYTQLSAASSTSSGSLRFTGEVVEYSYKDPIPHPVVLKPLRPGKNRYPSYSPSTNLSGAVVPERHA